MTPVLVNVFKSINKEKKNTDKSKEIKRQKKTRKSKGNEVNNIEGKKQ